MKKFIIFMLLSALVAGCSPQKQTDNRLQVFVSFYAMECFADEIAKDKANIINLSENGSVHDFEISATQMARLSKADLFIYSGDADNWANDVSKTAKAEGCKTLALSPDGGKDPHTWLDPDKAIEQMEKVYLALCEASPEDSENFKANLDTAKEKYTSLKERTKALSEKTQDKTMVVAHGAYGHLADELNMKQFAIEGIHSEGDPTAAHMAQTIDFVKDNNIKYIFTSPNETSKAAMAVAAETDAELLLLDAMEADNQSGGYFEVMAKNLDTIEQSLEG